MMIVMMIMIWDCDAKFWDCDAKLAKLRPSWAIIPSHEAGVAGFVVLFMTGF